MTKEKLFLLDVLRSFIHEEKLNFDVELDWTELIRLSTIHNLTGVLGYMVMQNPCEKIENLTVMLKRQCVANIAIFAQRTESAKQLLAKLNDAGIDHMVFKGFVVREYYPVPELRSFGDIDILIKSEDRKKCHELMVENGFKTKTDWEPVFSYYKGSELYEMHTEVMEIDVSDKADYKAYFRTAWDHVKNAGCHTYEPTPEFHLIYLLTHIAKHICGSGAGIRMYMDLAVFIQRFGNNIDWSYVNRNLEELKLADFANVALTIVEEYFGVASPIALRDIDEGTFESLVDYTMDGGVFGHAGRDSALITLKKSEESSRGAILMRRLFPKAETIERRYTYLQGNHWLLPVAWVHRFFKTSNSWSEHAEEAKKIMSTDDEAVSKLKRIYKEFGL